MVEELERNLETTAPDFIPAASAECASPLVSIIVLTCNGEKHVHRCLRHVMCQTHQPLEVIVVDNGSTDGSLQKLRAAYPELTYVENPSNRGFAAGMNQGIVASHGEFVIPLNNDVCLHQDFVAESVRRIKDDPGIGAIGGRVFSWVGDELTNQLRRGEGEHYVMRKRFQGDPGNVVAGEAWTFAPAGSFPFFRRKMLEDVFASTGHYYDEAFETGWEDGDLCFRMHLRGWKCLFMPTAFGWHAGSAAVGGKDTFLSKELDFQIRILRNRHFTIVKNLPARMLLWLLPYLIVTELAIPPFFLVRSPKSLRAWIAAWIKLVRALPEVLRKRSRIQKSRKVDPLYLKQYFVRF